MSTDELRKQIILKAPKFRVWRSISDSQAFGRWFGMKLDGPFVAGQKITGSIMPTTVDPEIAELQKPHVGKPVTLLIDRIEPEHLFSFRWHPFAIDPKIDYSNEPMTLITFKLEEKEDGTLLTITESGFDQIPASRRADALKANDGGWAKQTELIEKYLVQTK